LAQVSLTAFAEASPRAQGTPATQADTTWLEPALAILAQQPHPEAFAVTDSARYVLWAQTLCDVLASAYMAALRQGQELVCPYTSDEALPLARAHLSRDERAALKGDDWGLLLASNLPEAGRVMLADTLHYAGRVALPNTVNSDEGRAGRTETARPEVAKPKASSVNQPVETRALPVPDAKPVKTRTQRVPDAKPSAVDTAPPSSDKARLLSAVQTALADLVASDRFNRHGGEGWQVDGIIWVNARPFAERIQAQVEIVPEWENRKLLYRTLVAHELIVPDGSTPVWQFRVQEAPHPQMRFVSALRLAPVCLARIEGKVPAYQGRFLAQ